MPGARRRTANPAGVLDPLGLAVAAPTSRAAMAAGPVTSSTSRRASSGPSQPPTAVDSGNGRLYARRAGLAPGAGRRGLIRRRAQVNPVVQPFSDTATWATTKDSSEGVRLATHDQLVRRDAAVAAA